MIDPAFARVLIVEDRDDSYHIAADLLLYEVGVRSCHRALDGRSVIATLDEPSLGMIDLLLYDIKRPLRDEFARLPELRIHPKLVAGRIVALTANIMPGDVERTLNAGFDGFIGIPINLHRFPDQIRRIFADEFVWEPR